MLLFGTVDIWRTFPFTVKICALCVASTMTPAVTSRALLHRFPEKRHSQAHSEVPNGPVTKISYTYVCSNPSTCLVSEKLLQFHKHVLLLKIWFSEPGGLLARCRIEQMTIRD